MSKIRVMLVSRCTYLDGNAHIMCQARNMISFGCKSFIFVPIPAGLNHVVGLLVEF